LLVEEKERTNFLKKETKTIPFGRLLFLLLSLIVF
jgi:hypothetical protein